MTTDPTADPIPRPTTPEPLLGSEAPTPPDGFPAVGGSELPAPAQPGSQPDNPDAVTSIGDPTLDAAAPAAPAGVGRTDPADRSTGDLLRTLTDNVRSIVQGEVASARQEMTDKALAARPAAAMLGGAAVLGVLATGTSAVVVVRFLDRILPPTTSALVATALFGGGAAALARAGAAELRRIGPPVPERTLESVKADVAAVTEATPG